VLKERRNVGLQCCDLSQVEDFEVGRGALKPHGSSNVEIFALKLKPHGSTSSSCISCSAKFWDNL
jgi:hypothetical protein